MDSENNSNHLRVASFSSYLRTAEENTAHKHAELIQGSSITFKPTQESRRAISLGRSKSEVGEINVFGAEKYFNEIMDDDYLRTAEKRAWRHGHKSAEGADMHDTKPKVMLGTPSVSSESLNSQTTLLPSLARNSSRSKQRKANDKRFFGGFGCKGSCADKKSVCVDENIDHGSINGKEHRKDAIEICPNPVMLDGKGQSQPGFQIKDEFQFPSFRKTTIGLSREDCFAFPTLSSVPENMTVAKQLEEKKADEESRKSLEVFGSHLMKKGDIATNLERKLSMLTWDAIPKVQCLSTTSRSAGTYEDNESDASSDLFEIENLNGNGHPYLMRQDSVSSCMTPTGYEPSEGSIKWSVVTASAADYSAVSDYDDNKPFEHCTKPQEMSLPVSFGRPTKTKFMMGKEVQQNYPTGLLGCMSHKAVRVAETAHRANEKAKFNTQHPILDSSLPIGRLQSENMVKNVEFPWPQHAFASRELSSSCPARAAVSPYMQ
ncbi:protein PHYTOCHROME KINASE SUBSTRATE 3-like [Malania oleifera]|uniref:protein PHYTOCHROME KINASE SUBSTRATE 3-like n=1 Tax=Malania oleifera TaxID=397392 RepID=UPI0025ADFD9C|nr:protein PHYTOCHROME KINASE SUBSTRATE 3-like [Malania oleifera]